MNYKNDYDLWVHHSNSYKDMMSQLLKIGQNKDDVQRRFTGDLKFGTAGLRGIMGVGTDRLNIFTIRKTTQGLSKYLKNKFSNPSVAISFDSRINSELFARESTNVLAANGIKVYITRELSPTPFLSFAVRKLKCQAGIMITASHNPPEYNGYKCYNEDGAQMDIEETEEISNYIKNVDIFKDVKVSEFDNELKSGSIQFVDKEIHESYIKSVLSQRINILYPLKCPLSVTYTPLNGAGRTPVIQVLNKIGINNLYIVKEQENPDGNFATCKCPNPENEEAFKLAIENAKKNNSDIIIATDPDSDRLGVSILHRGNYQLFTGNELGIILFHYILTQKKLQNNLPSSCIAVRTIVSSKMLDIIAKEYNCKIVCVPTGFKYIGKEIKNLEQDNFKTKFIFGFEESNGYLVGTYARDKDAISAAMLTCEMASFYKSNGYSLVEVLDNLKQKYGFYLEKTLHFQFNQEMEHSPIPNIMKHFRSDYFQQIGKIPIVYFNDYLNSQSYNLKTKQYTNLSFPKLDIVSFDLSGNNSIIIRPSGTEPKLKVYITSSGKTQKESKNILVSVENYVKYYIEELTKNFNK